MKFPLFVPGSAADAATGLSQAQQTVLLEALRHTLNSSVRCGRADYPPYHRGHFGFGIRRRTAVALAKRGLVTEWVQDKWMIPTQYVELTEYGFQVAMAVAEINAVVLPKVSATMFQ